MITCPSCGYESEVGTPLCGNCGRPFEGSGLTSPVSSGGGGFTRFVVLAFVVAVLGGVGWFVKDRVGDLVEKGSNFTTTNLTDPNFQSVDSPYKSVREIVDAINKGGLTCKETKVDYKDEWVTTGSCQVPRGFLKTHVQINIFFKKPSLDAAETAMRNGPFTYVHDANWFVATLDSTAKKIHAILGGELVVND